jgi:hypothetical protein
MGDAGCTRAFLFVAFSIYAGHLGYPNALAAVEKRIRDHLQAGKGILKVAHEVGVGHGTVQRIADAMRPFDAAAA